MAPASGDDKEVAAAPPTTEEIAEAKARELNIPFVRLDSTTVDGDIIDIIPESTARRLMAIPLFRVEGALSVAMTDPTDVLALDELRRLTGLSILPSLCTTSALQEALDRFYRVDSTVRSMIKRMQGAAGEEEEAGSGRYRIDEKDSEHPVVNLINMILLQAVRDGASDIHVEPDEDLFRVRYRVDGVLREAHRSGMELHASFVSRLKTMANMDIAEKRLPQDGRILLHTGQKEIDIRANSLPTVVGEKMCLRILDQNALRLEINELGFPAEVEEAWHNIVQNPDGVVLVTGPTGSGKTSTLYATLGELNSIDTNIVTVEDPVEYNFPIINQVQVNEKAGLTFASILRAILRQDPDIIMVGEIRDQVTAEISVRAALTGHFVLSTLHTNDSLSAVTRLVDMGIPPYLVASAVRGILAQRLVRRVCDRCREEVEPDPDLVRLASISPEERKGLKAFAGRGCRACNSTGYKGRTGIYELILITEAVSRAVVRGADEEELGGIAEGENALWTLREDGMRKMSHGITTLEEVVRVTRACEAAAESQGANESAQEGS